MMSYNFRNLLIPYKQGADKYYTYADIVDTDELMYNQPIYKSNNSWATQGIFTWLEPGIYTISGFIKGYAQRQAALSIGIDTNLVNTYGSTEVQNNLATFGNVFTITCNVPADGEWHRYSGQVEVATAGYAMPRLFLRAENNNYLYFSCLQLEVGTEMTLFEGYHSTWYIDEDGELTHTGFPEVPDKPFQLPLPKSVWRVDNQYEYGYPFNMLMPEIPDVGAFANASKLIRASIPQSVKYIGNEAFKNTKLNSVQIASDCTYYDMTFPEDCTINFYP